MSELHIEQIDKRFNGLDNKVLDSLDLHIPSGKTVALLGRSGSGKTTLLRIIAGFIDPDSGRIAMDNRVFFEDGKSVVPEKRNIGFVFQDLALFPHMDALENIGYGLPRSERKETGNRMLSLVGMAGFGNRYPHELSGGQQQRVAVARALANDPAIILADEPTGNLDLTTGEEIISLLKSLSRERNVTIISATHDIKMLNVSDQVVWIRDGRIERIENRDELSISVGQIDTRR